MDLIFILLERPTSLFIWSSTDNYNFVSCLGKVHRQELVLECEVPARITLLASTGGLQSFTHFCRPACPPPAAAGSSCTTVVSAADQVNSAYFLPGSTCWDWDCMLERLPWLAPASQPTSTSSTSLSVKLPVSQSVCRTVQCNHHCIEITFPQMCCYCRYIGLSLCLSAVPSTYSTKKL